MTEKFKNLQVMTGFEIAALVGARCESFNDWPQGGLPSRMLLQEECRIETEFGSIADIKSGAAPKKAERALATVHESHPLIRTSWGLLYGRIARCEQGAKKYHAVEIHSPASWGLDMPEIRNRFGRPEEFNPYADVAYELMNYEVSQQNAGVKDYVIDVTRDVGASLIELSCKFKPSGDKTEEKAAFSALMRFLEKLFQSGRLAEIISQSCGGAVLQQAMISALWSSDMGIQLDAMKKVSGAKSKVRKFADLPVLSNESVAATLMTLGVNAGEWPRASFPDDLLAVHKERIDQALRVSHPKAGVRERSKMVKEALSEMMTPGAVLRTSVGMIRLALQTVEKHGSDRGAYQLTIYLARKWSDEESGVWSERARDLLVSRSAHLLVKPADYEIEVKDCADGYGMLQVSCDFDLYGGEVAQDECKQALVDYVFTIYATGMIEDVMAEACSNVGPVVEPIDLKAA